MNWRTALLAILLTSCSGRESTLDTARDNIDSTDPTCSLLTPSQLHDAAMDVFNNQIFNPHSCFDDTNCPCGSYCSSDDSVCEVECVPNPATGEPTCAAGKACTTSGRCADAPNTPPPALAMSVAFGDPATSANTTTGAVALPIQVTTSAISIGALDDAEVATVHFSIQEFREQQLGLIDDPPPVFPLIKCTSTGTFANECDLVGGWSYNVTSGAIRSQPRTIWIQVPQTATPLHWTLEARSANASGTATEVITATPVITPATDPGHYKGTLSYANSTAASPAISIPIEAIVTDSAIVVLEPSKLVFADGQVVIPRTTATATQFAWLSTTAGQYYAELTYDDAAYDPTTGHLDANLEVKDGTGADSTSLTLSLDRTGEVDAPSCPCASGSYCNTRLARCLPGNAPTDQVSVDPPTYHPSSTLASAGVAAWTGSLLTAAGGSSALVGSTHALLQEAYCFNGSSLAGALDPSVTSPTSGDQECEYTATQHGPQQTFSFEEVTSDNAPGTGSGAAQGLLGSCAADLAATPTGSTASSLMPTKACASLGRFYLALAAGDGAPMPDIDQRLVMQILRQWLGVTAYVAHTEVQDRDYDDALSVSGAPAYQRFGAMLDQVDADLRVLLDPDVLPQYTSGAGLRAVLAQPDYRIRPRPLARWSFNTPSTPGLDTEGHNPLTISGVGLSGSKLSAEGNSSASCRSANTLPAADRRYSIVLALDYNPPAGSRLLVFNKKAATDFLRIEASPGSSAGMTLRMYDKGGRSVTFPDVQSGLIAISVDASSYTLYSAPNGDPTHVVTIRGQSVVNGGPVWGTAGIVELNCSLPPNPNTCTSWDRNALGDGLDYTTHAPYVVHSTTNTWSCKTFNNRPDQPVCSGTQPSTQTCTNTATALRTSLHNQIVATHVDPASPPPAGPLAALTTHGGVVELSDVLGSGHTGGGYTTETMQWRCDTTVTGLIAPITAAKLVCSEPLPASYDEVSVWDRPVQLSEVADMAQRYRNVATNDSMPPVTEPVGPEQATALPVSLIETAAADLELLAAYAKAEQVQAYGECYLGGHSAALDRMAQRGGPNLRLVSVLEREADSLALIAKIGGTAPWYARYSAAKQQLAARRTLAVQALVEANKCENPLGISEQVIPLYVGEDVGANAKFFASSRYLAGEAQTELTRATAKLADARTAYTSQREQTYQLEESAATKQERIDQLRANAESQLEHYCGSSTSSLYDALLEDTVTNNNCFIDRTLSQCAGFASATLESLPQECLRGELGSQVLAIKTAGLTMAAADDAMHDSIANYDGALEHCAQEQFAFDGDDTILHDHDVEMERLHDEQVQNDLVLGLVNAGLGTVSSFVSGAPLPGITALFGGLTQFNDATFASMEQAEQSSYTEEVQHRSHEQTIANCYYQADNLKFQIDAARDQLQTAKQQLENANHQLAVDSDQLTAIVDVTAGQIGTENTLEATPPHLHYWLDENISEYQRHLEAARRLTYLAVRALEYEAQASLNLRDITLTASVPDVLQGVIDEIDATNAPLGGQLGVSVNDNTVVLSLRDEILKLSQSTNNVPGDPVLTPVQQFQRYLRSNSSVYLDANGKQIGRGIRFALAPDTWNTTMCDERIWRIQPSLQSDNPPNQHTLLLYQVNTFGSQDCHADPGAVLVSHADPASDLLVDNTFALPQLGSPQPYVVSNFDGPTGLDHTTLASQPESSVATFAGRGLYSNYVLLFPEPLWTDADIANVKDVLLRFDISDVTHAPHL